VSWYLLEQGALLRRYCGTPVLKTSDMFEFTKTYNYEGSGVGGIFLFLFNADKYEERVGRFFVQRMKARKVLGRGRFWWGVFYDKLGSHLTFRSLAAALVMMLVVMLIVSYGISHYDLNSNIGVLVVLSYTWALFRLPLLSNDLYPASRRDRFWSVWYYSLLGGVWMAFLYVGVVWMIGWLRMFMFGISRGALEAYAMEVSYLFIAWLLLPVIYRMFQFAAIG